MRLHNTSPLLLAVAIALLAVLSPRALAASVVIDDFADNAIGDVWNQKGSGTGASLSETNQRLEFHFDANAREGPTPPNQPFGDVSAGVRHACKVAGDFDVGVDFNLTEWPKENGVRFGMLINGFSVQRGWDAIFGNFYVAGPGPALTWVNTTDTLGQLRLQRVDSTVTASFNAGGNWQTITSANVNGDPTVLDLRAWTHNHLLDVRPEESQQQDITVTLDNLKLASGNFVCNEVDSVEFTQAIQVLQPIDELLEELEADGNPPVPIVAGKPAAMRVYFDEVTQTTKRRVEVTGEVTGSQMLTLDTGCDVDKRRKQEGGCQSADFYFTPPDGNWEVTVNVYDGDELREHYDFELRSVEADGIVLRAVSVCDAISSPGVSPTWECAPATALGPLTSLMRKIAPTHDVRVVQTSHVVRYNGANYPDANDWKNRVKSDVNSLYNIWDSLAGALSGNEIYYIGMVRPGAPGTYYGSATLPGRGAVIRTSAPPASLPHETGHMMGLEHTKVGLPGGNPGCWASTTASPAWPYADNKLQSGPGPNGDLEVGFDVATKKALPGDKNFELMGYCHVRWISPFTTLAMLGPGGPLSSAAAVNGLLGGSAPVGGEFWLMSGTIGDAVAFDPLFKLEAEVGVGSGAGPFRIEVQDGGGLPLFTRFFTPATSSADLPPGAEPDQSPPSFGELIPVQAGAARIVVIDDQDAEIGSLVLGGTAPAVTITEAGVAGDVVNVAWTVEDSDSAEHTYWVDYSADGGVTWQNQGMGLMDAALTLDAGMLAGSDNAVFRVIASDGVNSGEAVSAPFAVSKKLPHGEIIGPSGNAFRVGDLVWLEAVAWDIDDGTLDDGSVTWSSNRDGALGSGASLPVYDLSLGTHTITMTATDSDNNTVSDSIAVTVFDAPIVEGEPAVLSGDVDCNGAVNSIDALKLSRHVAGLSVAQTEPCPDIGTGGGDIFGDVNCDGSITAVDALFVLRFVAGMPVNLPQGCRPVGT